MTPVVLAVEPPAYARIAESEPLVIVIFTGPTANAPAASAAIVSSPVAETSKSGSFTLT